MNIQVSNLDLNATETDLQRLFTPFGEIDSIEINRDQFNNRSRGKAFIDMPVEKEAQMAILNLNGKQLGAKKIVVTGTAHNNDSLLGRLRF